MTVCCLHYSAQYLEHSLSYQIFLLLCHSLTIFCPCKAKHNVMRLASAASGSTNSWWHDYFCHICARYATYQFKRKYMQLKIPYCYRDLHCFTQ